MAEAGERGSDYDNPLVTRYASRAMGELFSPRRRALVWRDLWIALADCQRELGLGITPAQVDELRRTREAIDLDRVAALEAELRHDVMAHIHHWGELAPEARPILHLGATSCFVTDNADLILMREALALLEARLVAVVVALAERAREHASLPCLAYTHFQPAQPTTFGKRVCLWIQDFLLDLDAVARQRAELPLRGVKGTTGTQASFLDLFGGDHSKVRELDRRVAARMGFERTVAVTGQTYSRKIDHAIVAAVAGIAHSAAKLGVDFRLLSHEGEVAEPFTDKQVGSSAMPYKRNPMRCERICSLARLPDALLGTLGSTAATQWLERTLDDSAIRRIALPEVFLAAEACLILAENVARGMSVYPKVMRRHLDEHLPFLATELLLMEGVRAGGDRQTLHERLRVHSVEAARRMKEGEPNPLLACLRADPTFAFAKDRWPEVLDAGRLVGRAPQQVAEFLAEEVEPRLRGRRTAVAEGLRV